MDKYDEIIDGLTLEDLCGQVICYDRSVLCNCSHEEMKRIIDETRPGGVFVYDSSKEEVKKYSSEINSVTKIPVIIATDAEHGPGGPLRDQEVLPQPVVLTFGKTQTFWRKSILFGKRCKCVIWIYLHCLKILFAYGIIITYTILS